MTKERFNRLVRELFGGLLGTYGFTTDGSRNATVYRKRSDLVYHFILPEQFRDRLAYDVRVYPSSPVFYGADAFVESFPDDIGEPTGGIYLNERSIGEQDSFACETEESMRAGFASRIKPAILDFALPFLDGIVSLEDMIPHLKSDLSRGLALIHIGDTKEGRAIVSAEYERLKLNAKKHQHRLARRVKYIEDLLNSNAC